MRTSAGRASRQAPAVLGLIALVLACEAVVGAAVYLLLPDWSTRSQFGDMFGVASALFSGLAFAGLIYTILLQRADLQLQREELQLTRAELQRTATAQEASQEALAIQAKSSQLAAELNAINFLLAYFDTEMEKLMPFAKGSSREAQWEAFREKRAALVEILERVFQDVAKPHRD